MDINNQKVLQIHPAFQQRNSNPLNQQIHIDCKHKFIDNIEIEKEKLQGGKYVSECNQKMVGKWDFPQKK